jgi:hypothetical protein
MSTARPGLTEAQTDLFETLDDVAEHVSWEFDPDEYQGISTIGFAHIKRIDGRSSFVQRAKALADSENLSGSPQASDQRSSDNDAVEWVVRDRRNPVSGRVAPVKIEVGSLQLRLAPSHDSGYRLSVSNVSDFRSGPEHQRLDVRERLNRLVLNRLQYHGYCDDAWVSTRMD